MDLEFKNYKITWEPIGEGLPESLNFHLQKLYKELENPKAKTESTLQKLIKKYPNSPQLRNYLSSLYMELGEKEKAWQVNDVLLQKHPDYFFAKVNKANQFMEEQEFGKVVDLMGKGFDLKELYPDRDVFHISAFLSMQNIAVKYYGKIGDLVQAEKRLEMMKEVDQESAQYQQAKGSIEVIRIEKMQERLEEEERKRITPKTTFKFDKNIKFPQLQLRETDQLYEKEILSEEFIDTYLSLDREKVIADLETVLKKSYHHHQESSPDYEAVHALFMLGALEAEKSLPVVLEMMRQDEDYFDDVFGTIYTELAWIPLLKLSKNQLNLIEDYLKLPGLHTYFRSVALDALTQVYCHYPNRAEEVVEIYKNLLHYFSKVNPEENIIDSQFISFLIWDLADLKQAQLLPKIKALYEKGYVLESVSGSFEEVEKDIKKTESDSQNKREIKSLKEIYRELSTPSPFDSDWKDSFSMEDSFYDKLLTTEETFTREHKKIGRNDPCPCGSGKKFKKCCLGKGIYD